MLPDLRIVIAAVVSTFIFTVGVGFFASSRLIHEQMTARVDTKGFDDTPVNRIALNWPEPTRIERKVDLDFAVSVKGSGQPVRDVTPEPAASETARRDPAPEAEPVPQVAHAPDAGVETPPLPAPEAASPSHDERPEPESVIAVAESSEPVEAAAPDPAPSPVSPAEARVTVHPADTLPVESTGSISAPAPAAPDIPLPEARPKFAARPDAADTEAAARPGSSEPARTSDTPSRRPKKAAVRPRTAGRTQLPQVPQQLQPFDFFGLFRVQPAFRPQPQVSIPPAVPIN